MESSRRDGVNPTARWLARGVWKAALAIVLFLLALAVLELVR